MTTLTINTTARTAANGPSRLAPWLPGGTRLAGFVLPCARRRRALARVALMALATGCMGIVSGCGGNGGDGGTGCTPASGTPTGTSTVTITATAGNTTHSASYAFTVCASASTCCPRSGSVPAR